MPIDDVRLAEFFDKDGRLYTPVDAFGWKRPESVRLCEGDPHSRLPGVLGVGAQLVITKHTKPNAASPAARVRPTPLLLEKFINLPAAPDANIAAYCRKYGTLGVFRTLIAKSENWENCGVCRYFSACFFALLRIAGSLYSHRNPDPKDWEVIGNAPPPIREWHRRAENILDNAPEHRWSIMVHFVRKGDRGRHMLAVLVNGLLDLGKVSLGFEWVPGAPRPRVSYCSSSLLSFLTLQLCLRLAKVESLILCNECGRLVINQRAPKAGQRSFCSTCRAKGVPKKYALRAFRARQRKPVKTKTETRGRRQASSTYREGSK
jgi:hypothetical protein